MFVDRVTIYCQAGDGGDGCMSFRREAYVPRGGPDGGDGGRGGSVIVLADRNVSSLANIVGHKHWRAERGAHGQGKLKTGKSGEDAVIRVPTGTLVKDADRGHLLKDLAEDGEQLVVAQGGKGGHGNKHFATATNRAPRECEPGEPGQTRNVVLELKLIADVGLVGLPNAGKSTLLSRLSRAQPEIADYPFTTKYPNLGLVRVGYDREFVLADIPGLIEGAHTGVGLGHEFLKHVERTRVLVHLVEPQPMDGSDPVENYHTIRNELSLYDPTLAERPEIIAISKAELPDAGAAAELLAEDLGRDVLQVSAVTGKGLPELIRQILERLDAVEDR
ncbi:MAG: GTPase ObgE [Planctomycetaceae bacterium]